MDGQGPFLLAIVCPRESKSVLCLAMACLKLRGTTHEILNRWMWFPSRAGQGERIAVLPERCLWGLACLCDAAGCGARVWSTALMPEFNVVEQAQEQLTDLFESELQLAMRALLHQDSCRLQSVDAVEAEKCVALRALVWLRWHLVANDALKDRSFYLYILSASPIQLDLGLGQLLYNLLNLCVPGLHPLKTT